jgi:uncharacterized membrane protein
MMVSTIEDWRATGVECPDGVRRTVRLHKGRHADTFFSIPAQVTYKGKTVTGFITTKTDSAEELDLVFFANRFGKNGEIFDA